MNEHDESEVSPPPIIPDAAAATAATPADFRTQGISFWARRLLVCNPFYLLSAALLLFGLYRVSIDRNFLSQEVAQIAFNLTSLQLYEILLVVTAIFLARRSIWYESTLLAGLENMLLFVPFILISQAALLNERCVWAVCLAVSIVRRGPRPQFETVFPRTEFAESFARDRRGVAGGERRVAGDVSDCRADEELAESRTAGGISR